MFKAYNLCRLILYSVHSSTVSYENSSGSPSKRPSALMLSPVLIALYEGLGFRVQVLIALYEGLGFRA